MSRAFLLRNWLRLGKTQMHQQRQYQQNYSCYYYAVLLPKMPDLTRQEGTSRTSQKIRYHIHRNQAASGHGAQRKDKNLIKNLNRLHA